MSGDALADLLNDPALLPESGGVDDDPPADDLGDDLPPEDDPDALDDGGDDQEADAPAPPAVPTIDDALLARLAAQTDADGRPLYSPAFLAKFKGQPLDALVRMQHEAERKLGEQGRQVAAARRQAPAIDPALPDVVKAALALDATAPETVRAAYQEEAAKHYALQVVDALYEEKYDKIYSELELVIRQKGLTGELDADEVAEKLTEAQREANDMARRQASTAAWKHGRDEVRKLQTTRTSAPAVDEVDVPAPLAYSAEEATTLTTAVQALLPAAEWPALDVARDIMPILAQHQVTVADWEGAPAEVRQQAVLNAARQAIMERAWSLYQDKRTKPRAAPAAGTDPGPARGSKGAGKPLSAAQRREQDLLRQHFPENYKG